VTFSGSMLPESDFPCTNGNITGLCPNVTITLPNVTEMLHDGNVAKCYSYVTMRCITGMLRMLRECYEMLRFCYGGLPHFFSCIQNLIFSVVTLGAVWCLVYNF